MSRLRAPFSHIRRVRQASQARRPLFTSLLDLLALVIAVAALCAAGYALQHLGPSQQTVVYAQASAITADYRDVDVKVNSRTHQATISRQIAPGMAAAAPLMDWNNADVRGGTEMTWCFAGMEAESAGVLRDTLDQLHTAFPDNVKWREACPGAYTTGDTAAQDCGMAEAVACAVYLGPHNGRVSINGNYLPQMNHQGRITALAHESQHIILNLGHNACGQILDPSTGRPVPSVMTPVDLSTGLSCSAPAARGLTSADWAYAYGYYHLAPPQTRVTPVPTAVPTASPTPVPPPVKAAAPTIYALRLVPGSDACRNFGDWCLDTTQLPGPPVDGAYYVLEQQQPDGSWSVIGDYQWVTP